MIYKINSHKICFIAVKFIFMKLILKTLQSLDNLITYIFSNLSKEDKFIKSFFGNKKIIFFDIGANLGGYVDFISKNINIKKAYLFEPSIKCLDHLKKNYTNIKYKIINKALSNKQQRRIFYESEILSQSSLHKTKNKFNSNLKNLNTYYINCTTLDKFYLEHKKNFIIDLLKIDAEGEDLKVLHGCRNLLRRKKIKLIKIELLNSFDKSKSNIAEIISFLEKNNYHLITITKTKFVDQKLLMLDAYFCQKKVEIN